MRAFWLAVAVTAALVPAASALEVDRTQYRYVRVLPAEGRPQPLAFEPDAPMIAHTKRGLADLRILDGRGEQVPWRRLTQRGAPQRRVRILNSGKREDAAVALLDLGRRRQIVDRIELDVPDSGFVGRVTVLGADRRTGPFTRLSTTAIYDIAGAQRARSTTAVFPPTDFRFLQLRATGVTRIAAAAVSGTAGRPRLVPRRHAVRQVTNGRETVFLLDFGVPRVPVTEVAVTAATRVYAREATVEGSNDRRAFLSLATARVVRFPG